MFEFIRKLFARKEPVAPVAVPNEVPDSVVIERAFHKPTALLYRLRRGMWVVHPDGVGVLTNVYDDGTAKLMFVDEAGLNKKPAVVDASTLSQAKYGDIPQPRRPDKTTAARLGYI